MGHANRFHPAIAEDESIALWRGIGIDRHIGGAGLQNAEDRRHHIHRFMGVDSHPVAGLHPVLFQQVTEHLRPACQFPVGQHRTAGAFHCGMRWTSPPGSGQQIFQMSLHTAPCLA